MDCLIENVPPAKLARFIIHVLTMKKHDCKSNSGRMILDIAIRILLSEDDYTVFPNGLDSEVTNILLKVMSKTQHTQTDTDSAKNLTRYSSGKEKIGLKAKPKDNPKQYGFNINGKKIIQQNKCKGQRYKIKIKTDSVPPKKVSLHQSPSKKKYILHHSKVTNAVHHTAIANGKKSTSFNSSKETASKIKKGFHLNLSVSSIKPKDIVQENHLKGDKCEKETPLTVMLTPCKVSLQRLQSQKKYIPSIPKVNNPSTYHTDTVNAKMSSKLSSNQEEVQAKWNPHQILSLFNLNIKDTGQENNINGDTCKVKVEDSTVDEAPIHADAAIAKVSNNVSVDKETVLGLKRRHSSSPSVSGADTMAGKWPKYYKSETEQKLDSLFSLHKEDSLYESPCTNKNTLQHSEVRSPSTHYTDIQPSKSHRKPLLPLPPVQHKRRETKELFSSTEVVGESIKRWGNQYLDEVKKMSFTKSPSAERIPSEQKPKKRPLLPLPPDKNHSLYARIPPVQTPYPVRQYPAPYSKWRETYRQRKVQYVSYYYQIQH